MKDTLTTEQIEQGYTMRADYIGEDEWSRPLYQHPSGRKYALIQGSLSNKPILYALSRDGEPDYPITIAGERVTREKIAGKYPTAKKCFNCSAVLSPTEAADAEAQIFKHNPKEQEIKYFYMCIFCQREADQARQAYAEATEPTHEQPAI